MAGRERVFRIPCLLHFFWAFALIVLPGLVDATDHNQTTTGSGIASSTMKEDEALRYSQSAIGNRLGDHHFTDSDGNRVSLSEFLGKPLVISFIYTSCYHICPTLTTHLAGVVRTARDALGEDKFSVITVGFDTVVDKPGRMHMFASERRIKIPGWKFLSTDRETMDLLGRETGFIYYPSPKGYDHLAQTTLVDGDGIVYRQIYGENFESPLLVEPLKELIFGERTNAGIITNWVNNVRLFCTIYDPASGRYRFDYSIFIAIGVGIVVLGTMAIFIVRIWRQGRTDKPV